ncbi:virulence sensor histidine kinase PhoQ [Candidatus Phycosocius bacilliformis]|uniref:histidine kinase n=1 Tax=Candidatus Phycosocius bacilliformis TaxID=1445552 RepID=A0A2P2EAW3_9PROT|nr:ATP-binding protein [Candidatus Phycosocius bacilliformis]GBF58204.1 virulence sensor histidine kinase PhoQ [Candidatus Phycosocius bacilliformis]
MTNRRSLAGRLVAVAAIWSTLVLVATGYGLSAFFRQSVFEAFDRELAVNLDALAATVETDAAGGLVVPRPPTDPRFFRPLSGHYWRVVDVTAQGGVVGIGVNSRSVWDEPFVPPHVLVQQVLAQPGITQTILLPRDKQLVRVAGRLVQLPGHDRQTLLMVGADTADANAAIDRFSLAVAIGLLALAGGLLGAIFLQVQLGLEPLRRMGRELVMIRNGDRDRLDEDAPRELAPLAHEINALISHNQEVVERARTHVGNLAHALKTPLSVLLTESRHREGEFEDLVARQTQAMTRQVEHYLKRASAAARAETLGARTLVGPVIDDVVRTLTRLFREEGVKISAVQEPGLVFRGEKEDLEDLIGNLAENACKYGGGLVEIQARHIAGGQLEILIEDDGEGLEGEALVAAIKRGARLDETLPGSGLGLSICDELARAYGGSLRLDRSELGGLRASLTLPAADTSQ